MLLVTRLLRKCPPINEITPISSNQIYDNREDNKICFLKKRTPLDNWEMTNTMISS